MTESNIPLVQVFGQPELVEHLEAGGEHHTHCVSIGNPFNLFGVNRHDTRVPRIIRREFKQVLRLRFYDVEAKRYLTRRQFPKKIPTREDVRRAIQFFESTSARASGYSVHCWQGVSRSTAIALGYLYMYTRSESKAAGLLKHIRPEAGPHMGIVRFFDEELGSRLVDAATEVRDARLLRWKAELELTEDSLLEELPGAEEDE